MRRPNIMLQSIHKLRSFQTVYSKFYDHNEYVKEVTKNIYKVELFTIQINNYFKNKRLYIMCENIFLKT